MSKKNIIPSNVEEQFVDVVSMIQKVRNEVFRLANTSLIDLYWKVGAYISDKNLWRMKQLYETYIGVEEKLSPLVRQISWTNNLLILSRTKTIEEKEFYLHKCISERLSKRELDRQISSALFERSTIEKPKLSTVLRQIVPEAEKVFRDQYVLEFIGGKKYRYESTMKRALTQQMKNFILELGKEK